MLQVRCRGGRASKRCSAHAAAPTPACPQQRRRPADRPPSSQLLAGLGALLLLATPASAQQMEVHSHASGGGPAAGTEPMDPFARAALYSSPECTMFYARRGLQPERPVAEGNMVVWENFHEAIEPYATDMVYCPQHHLVYVDNAKAGSSTLRTLFREWLGCGWNLHAETWPESESAGKWARCRQLGWDEAKCNAERSRTDWLTPDVVAKTLFFSVVREPVTRFESGYKQATFMSELRRDWSVAEYLEHYRTTSINEHTQTQARRLSGRDAQGKQVPMHFIASLENLEHDLELLWAHLGLSQAKRDRGEHQIQHVNTAAYDPLKQHINATLTAEQLRELCEHLAQDFVCFGYALPPECR